MLAKQSGRSEVALKQIGLSQQDQLFNEIYGAANQSIANILFSANLAAQNIKRFRPAAFRLWLWELAKIDPELPLKEVLEKFDYPNDMPAFLQGWVSDGKLDTASSFWLIHALRVVPDWSQLLKPGPWLDDARAAFVRSCLEKFSSLQGELTAELIAGSRAVFEDTLAAFRNRLPGGFLPRLLLLVEGPTEELLIPHFALSMKFSLDAAAIAVVAAGGANQAARQYVELAELLSLPVMVVLDGDARSQATAIRDCLRDCDRLIVLSSGETEDTFQLPVLIKWLNYYLQNGRLSQPIDISDFRQGERRIDALNRLWRSRGLGDFDKIGFARAVTEREASCAEIPPEIKTLIQELKALSNSVGYAKNP